MQISTKAWIEYIEKMSGISEKAAEMMQDYIRHHGFGDRKAIIDFAFALTSKYGEAVGTLACELFEITAEAQNVLALAEQVPTPEYGEVAKAINGTIKQSELKVPATVGRMIKQVGADTTLQNAIRYGAEAAWVPHGDTCAFCITLASRGWQKVSKKTLKNGHAEHIHGNCDCQYAIRFDGKSTVQGYDPDKYLEIYNNADPNGSPNDKINAIRRMYEEQKRQLSFDMTDSETRKRVTEFTAFKANESRYGIYVSENANRKTQNLSNIEKALDTALGKLGIEYNENFPRLFVLTHEEVGTEAFAAYNSVKNELYISDSNGDKRKIIALQKFLGYADAKSPDSTVRHELIHWLDAEKYKRTGSIANTEEYKQYLRKLREDCKIKLEEAGISATNVSTISDYAEQAYLDGKYDETYTEYRVLQTGGK